MGLDLVLGMIIVIAAIRGWFKGFTSQAVRIGGFISCFYLADPVREQARPYVLAKLPTIEPALMDRILWWACAVVSYIVLVGFSTLAIQLMRAPPEPGVPRSRRGDRFAGLFLGAVKGLLVVAFLAAGVQKYGADLASNIPWADRQTQGSFALQWTDRYQPVPRIWAAPPVRRFVEHIQRNGLKNLIEAEAGKQVAERTSTEAEEPNPAPRLAVPPAEQPPTDTVSQGLQLDPEIVKELERYKSELESRNRRP
jgi:uncharacterized membrane protein required for colicin V production